MTQPFQIRPATRRDASCQSCGTGRGVRAGARYCNRCREELDPTPLQRWRMGSGYSVADVAETTGLGRAAVSRADAGERVSLITATRLHRLTKIPVETFRPEEGSYG